EGVRRTPREAGKPYRQSPNRRRVAVRGAVGCTGSARCERRSSVVCRGLQEGIGAYVAYRVLLGRPRRKGVAGSRGCHTEPVPSRRRVVRATRRSVVVGNRGIG